ncbi:hypothetical protein PGT21_016332 [Puccinia graminis f. sp. tritici]|uniref:Uncharacterized protein n=1 Tax=Puccinia graminis f. sp. tritici TaxID=56615 RepID=A0A5B0QNC4_PUCGR|nr:hypothetical protein PGT21_016332 [Puccinia graminis f. sp. tritici]
MYSVADKILHIIGQSKKNLDVYLDRIKGRLHWLMYISGSHTFPCKRQYYCSSDEQLQVFAEEVARKPLQKVFIRVEMDDPTAKEKSESAKEKSARKEKNVEKSLAIAVGSESERVPLQREEARQLQNGHSDVRGDQVAPFVVQLRQHLEKESNTKPSEVIFWPHKEIPNLVLWVNHDRLWAWAHVLLAKSLGKVTDTNQHVDLNNPPTGSIFKWEKRSGITPLKHRIAVGNPDRSRETRPRELAVGNSSSTNTRSARSSVVVCPNLDPELHDFASEETSVDIKTPEGIYPASKASSESIEYMNELSVDSSISGNYVTDSYLSTPHEHRRKMARSPTGDPTQAFSRMSVGRAGPSPSPTRKIPREPMLPLQPAGKLVTLDEFLVHCNIDVADAMCQTLFKGHDVKHWSFFRGKSDEDLMRIGFTRGLATHLSNGASDYDSFMITKMSS